MAHFYSHRALSRVSSIWTTLTIKIIVSIYVEVLVLGAELTFVFKIRGFTQSARVTLCGVMGMSSTDENIFDLTLQILSVRNGVKFGVAPHKSVISLRDVGEASDLPI